jgi:hypothetical protein
MDIDGMKRQQSQNGQSIVEYIFVLIIIAAIAYFVVIPWVQQNLLKNNEQNVNSQGAWEIGEIRVLNEKVTDILAIDTVTLPNCNGSSELTVERNFTQEIAKEVTFKLDVNVSLPLELLQSGIRTHFGVTDSQSLTESFNVQMSAAPGTTVIYEVEWTKTSTTGEVDVIQGDTKLPQEFTIVDSLKANLREPTRIPCPTPTS